MNLTEQVKKVIQSVVSIGESSEYLHNSLNNMGIENKVEEEAGNWSVFFRNENSTEDSPSFTHLEFKV